MLQECAALHFVDVEIQFSLSNANIKFKYHIHTELAVNIFRQFDHLGTLRIFHIQGSFFFSLGFFRGHISSRCFSFSSQLDVDLVSFSPCI